MIEIPADIRDRMVEHAFSALPNEACGLLAGTDGRVERFYPMHNADDSRTTYRLDPREQFEVFNQIEDEGFQLAGIYHSHTHTEAYPSETDRQQAFYPEAAYVLISLADRSNPALRAFRIVEGVIEEQEARIA